MDLGRVLGAAEQGLHRRHPLRHDVDQARHAVERRTRVDTLLDGCRPRGAAYITALCDGGYTTNLPVEDVTGGKAWVVYGYDGDELEPGRRAARLLVPHLYFWKSAKWVRRLIFTEDDEPGFWERSATTTAAIRGSSSATRATESSDSRRTSSWKVVRRRIACGVHAAPVSGVGRPDACHRGTGPRNHPHRRRHAHQRAAGAERASTAGGGPAALAGMPGARPLHGAQRRLGRGTGARRDARAPGYSDAGARAARRSVLAGPTGWIDPHPWVASPSTCG